ncbi:membrane fusion protein, multidrug efflux system [Variovorax sp. HW608]|uniref:HlyD family secretion protein n=1 Tax=Variovorax sp. HW608 TaxID=1034889 RepID=UPI000820192E|nr:efflux RND transporter periplasmic adaptor subunit [Variovorax sp. HW608]SCK32003.1 membrane fusion protein, multidrug efflux system [Variovorax sp. HW608]
MTTHNESTDSPAAANRAKRRHWLTGVAAIVTFGAVAYGGYFAVAGSRYESTDNAYVQGNIVQITPQLSGTVIAIDADDTDFVKAGQDLVLLDPVDAQVALEQAEAQLAQTVREVRTLYANNGTLAAQVKLHEADVDKARSDVAKAEDDAQRRTALLRDGAVSKEEFNHTNAQLASVRSSLAAAQAALVAARQQLASNQVLTDGTTADTHPSVLRAAARVREAFIALHRTALPAPVDGYVAKRGVQVGQRVAAGTPLMAVVPLNGVWVDANFKEGQLKKLRIGQTANLQADVYGKKVEYHGKVAGLGAGTGSAFSLLPAQNATGNWIKIVQRVAVRIELQPEELAAHPLRVGLSMDVTVDVRNTAGKTLADAPRDHAVASTTVFDGQLHSADDRVRDIVAGNDTSHASAPVDVRRVAAVPKSTPAASAL